YYGMPAYQAGIQENDVIISINDEPIFSWYDMRKIISKNPENPLQFVIKRGDGIFNCTVIPQINPGSDEKFGFIGIRQKTDLTTIEKFNFFTSIKFGFISTISRTYDYYDGIIRLFKTPSQIRKNLGGPLMIAAITGQQAEQGIDSFLSFMAMVSIILMVMNLLPIPILDGGLILFGFIEGIRQKPLKAPTQAVLQKIGLSIILALMIFAFYNDISKILFRNF
ncbi:MAG: RIP metalloprotease RseP, partial [Candidatus Cloacimonetes bacterium]|nr:RIP metalloprotease RseP [Candidatus Cloacimonadota bacterium]